MSTPKVRRYPLSLLVEASGLSEAALGRKVGLSGSSLTTARRIGLREPAADRYAVRAGLHPMQVWADWGMVPCVECAQLFGPHRKGHIYCTPKCKNRAAARRRPRSESYQARQPQRAAYMRQYRKDAAKALAASNRAWKAANRDRVRALNRESMRRYRARKREAA